MELKKLSVHTNFKLSTILQLVINNSMNEKLSKDEFSFSKNGCSDNFNYKNPNHKKITDCLTTHI